MKQLVFVLQSPERTPLPAEFSGDASSLNFCVSLLSPALFRARVRNFDAAETLVITDEEDCALSCKSLDLPVVGFEHDNVRLSCSEIILSLEDLSAADCISYFESLSGREVLWQSGGLSLRKMSEGSFVRFFALFRSEAYFLTEDELRADEASVRSLYRSRTLLSSLSRGFGPAEAVVTDADGKEKSVGCVAAFEEPIGDAMQLTIEYFVLPGERGKGFGKCLVRVLTDACAEHFPTSPLYAVVHPDNVASLATLKACSYLPLPAHQEAQTAPQSLSPSASRRFRGNRAPVLLVHYPDDRR